MDANIFYLILQEIFVDRSPLSQAARIAKGIFVKRRAAMINCSKAYCTKYRERHGIFKILDMSECREVEAVFTKTRFVESRNLLSRFQEYAKRKEEVELLKLYSSGRLEDKTSSIREQFFVDWDNKADNDDADRETHLDEWVELVNNNQFLSIIAEPGYGKTTLLKMIGLECLKGIHGGFKGRKIPVFINSSRLSSKIYDIEKCIIDELDICGFPNSSNFVRAILEKGRLVILIDGLDEIASGDLKMALPKIQDFADKYRNNNFVISCRTAAYKNPLRKFKDIFIDGFKNDQVEEFIKKWFPDSDQEQTGQKCCNLLNRSDNTIARQLSSTPLLLTFLCIVYGRYKKFASNRTLLCEDALNIILREWSAERNPDKAIPGINSGQEEILLSEIAYEMSLGKRKTLKNKEIILIIDNFIERNRKIKQNADSSLIFEAICTHQGILVEEHRMGIRHEYSFSHQILREYLAASYIHLQQSGRNLNFLNKVIDNHVFDDKWREILLLFTGLKNGADTLLGILKEKAQTFIMGESKALDLFKWSNQITKNTKSQAPDHLKRLILTILLISFLNLNKIHVLQEYAAAAPILGARNKRLVKALDRARKSDFSLIRNISLLKLMCSEEEVKEAISFEEDESATSIFLGSVIEDLIASGEDIDEKDFFIELAALTHTSDDDLSGSNAFTYAHSIGVPAKRSLTICNKLIDLKIINREEDLNDLKKKLEDLALEESMDPNLLYGYIRKKEINELWLKTLNVPDSLLNAFDENEEHTIEMIQKYFYIHELIILGLISAVEVQNKTWDDITDNFLSPLLQET
ncbi:MAG: NACHT domain-containing protein [Cyanobacteria bacterium P01_G01_bin.54]